VSDILLVGTLAKAGVKVVARIGGALVVKEVETTAAVKAASRAQPGAFSRGSSVGKSAFPGISRVANGTKEMTTRIVKGPWRPRGNNAALYKKPGAWKTFFYDPRKFNTVSKQYWKVSKGADGKALHHWLFQNQSTYIPQGIRNAGFNMMEIPASLNTWMGGRLGREVSFRAGVFVVMKATFMASYLASGAAVNVVGDYMDKGSYSAPQPPQLPKKLLP